MGNVILFDNFNNFKKILTGISRIYFGNGFCDHLLPLKKDIDTLVNLKGKRKVDFSIVTPYINQRNFPQLTDLLHNLNKNLPGIEIIVNDWGVLHLIKERFHNLFIVLGRLLSKQKRGFFIKSKLSGITLIENLNLKKADMKY
jgi:collagenase-like PrtC family protease